MATANGVRNCPFAYSHEVSRSSTVFAPRKSSKTNFSLSDLVALVERAAGSLQISLSIACRLEY